MLQLNYNFTAVYNISTAVLAKNIINSKKASFYTNYDEEMLFQAGLEFPENLPDIRTQILMFPRDHKNVR